MMKTFLGFLLLLSSTFFLAGCGDKKVDNAFLVQIDTLLAHKDADSAQALITYIRPLMLSTERDEAYYILLRENSAYLNMLPATSDSLINRCIAFYEKSGDERDKLLRAYFYKAIIQNKLEDYPNAIVTLKKCEDLALELKDRDMLCRVYSYISLINSVSNEYALAMQAARKYLDCAMTLDDKLWRAFALNQIATIFERQKMMDSAVFYINKCLPFLDKTTETKAYAAIYSNVGNINADRDPQLAKKYLEIAVRLNPSSAVYVNLASIYAKQGEEEKVDSLLNEGLKIASYKGKVSIAQFVVEHKEAIGDHETAEDYSLKLLAWKDSVLAKQKADGVDRVQAEYEYDKDLDAKDRQLRRLAILVALAAVIVVAVGYVLKRRWNRSMKHFTKEVTQLKKKDEEITQRTREQQKYIERLSQNRNESIGKGQLLYEALSRRETIVRWKDDDFESFFTYYFTKNTAFMSSLNADYEKLTNLMKLYLVLEHAQWDNKDIAATLGVKVASLRVIKKRIRDKKKPTAGSV